MDADDAEDILRKRKNAEEARQAQRRAAAKREKERRRMKHFLEDEAELGSDNEENDHLRKHIKGDDSDENEEGHD